MSRFARRCLGVVGLLVVVVCLCFAAADWKTATTIPGVDLTHLNPAQKTTVLKILRKHKCSCGCGMTLAECRMADPSCSYSNGLAAAVVDAIRQGKTEAQAIAAIDASKWAHVQDQQKLLEDAVTIPVSGSPSLGPANAPITIVEFSDFQCPYCAAAVPEIKSLIAAYPTQIKLIFKQFPLPEHPRSDFAAAAAIAANKQGKFWAMHDAMFAHRDDLSRKNVLLLAKEIGLDMDRFEDDLDSTEVREAVVRDVNDGDKAHVDGTPTIFFNGQRYNGAILLASMKPVMDAELKSVSSGKTQTASVKR